MKKLVIILLGIFFLTACNGSTSNGTYSGTETMLSKKYLSKGYLVNVYRSRDALGEDAENYGKGYITMTFHVLSDYYSVVEFNPSSGENIKKKTIRNLRIIKSPKMGTADELYLNYDSNGQNHVMVAGTKNKYELEYETPHSSGVQSSVAVKLSQIAFFDSSKYDYNAQLSMGQIYNDLGITRDAVALTLGFRVELTTVDNKILYKDYEIELPPNGFDIAGSQYQMSFMTDDLTKMEPFLEKE